MYNLLAEKKILAVSTVMALAFIMVMGPSSMAFNAFATSDNEAEQEIEQSQYASQIGICVSNDGNLFSCNNLAAQLQFNDGDNDIAQASGNGGDNEAEAEIEQEQGLKQSALCVSNDGNFLSCNNVGLQFQDNDGDNNIAQASGGFYGGDNEAEAEIEQSQYASQSGICVSNDGNLFSCNNLAAQLQFNDGDNNIAQGSSGFYGGDNEAEAEIEQEQGLKQSALCVSNDGNFLSCNNVGLQFQDNDGDNNIAQASGGFYGGDNEAEQSISQEQGLKQTSTSVSNGDNFLSGNNVGLQFQDNDGDNNIAQASGDDGGDNDSEQSISQKQDSEQSSRSVSNGDNEGSGNNISVQDQDNDGDNNSAQSSGGDDDDGDNDSEQSISQEQDSDQESTSVSNGDNEGSGNNISVQSQSNDGDNDSAQD